jgi:hypothetical protein
MPNDLALRAASKPKTIELAYCYVFTRPHLIGQAQGVSRCMGLTGAAWRKVVSHNYAPIINTWADGQISYTAYVLRRLHATSHVTSVQTDGM